VRAAFSIIDAAVSPFAMWRRSRVPLNMANPLRWDPGEKRVVDDTFGHVARRVDEAHRGFHAITSGSSAGPAHGGLRRWP
jgi:hypothetical protein